MIRINRLTDYAVVALVDMARSSGVKNAQKLADDTGVPLPTIAKLMKALARADLVISQRGASGGYVLSRESQDISVAEIIQAIEGPIAVNACLDEDTDACGLTSLCTMHGAWGQINDVILNALESVSLADMAKEGQNPFMIEMDPAPLSA